MTSPAADAGVAAQDDDPIVASYNVLVKPPLPANRRLLVMHHLNNRNPRGIPPPISELRFKSGAGMIELDVPVDVDAQYDRGKGVAWGTTLRKNMAAKGGGSYGLAGGFGVGAPPARSRRQPGARGEGGAGNEAEDDEDMLAGNGSRGALTGSEWQEALRQDSALRKQTIGGQAMEEKSCRFMIGVFQGQNLHLTPVSHLAHLRPQLHHLDAATEQDRVRRPTGGAGGAGGPAKEGTARAIHMTVKSASMADGDELVTETMADRLRAVQLEGWKRMGYVDEERAEAWDMYSESLLAEKPPAAEGQDGAGKGKEPATDAEEDKAAAGPGAADLAEKLGELQTKWGEEELLRAVSGIKAEKQKDVTVKTEGGKSAVSNVQGILSQDKKPRGRPGRPSKPTGAVPAAKRGPKPKAARGGTAANTIELDG